MKRKIINSVLAVILSACFTGCSSDKTFKHDSVSFRYPENYEMYSVSMHDVGYLFYDEPEGAFKFHLYFVEERGVSLTEITNGHAYAQIYDSDIKIEKNEDLTIDGKSAKLVTLKGSDYHQAFMVIEYEKEQFMLFMFYSLDYENSEQIINGLIDTMKFK